MRLVIFGPEHFESHVRFQTIGDVIGTNESEDRTGFDPKPTISTSPVLADGNSL